MTTRTTARRIAVVKSHNNNKSRMLVLVVALACLLLFLAGTQPAASFSPSSSTTTTTTTVSSSLSLSFRRRQQVVATRMAATTEDGSAAADKKNKDTKGSHGWSVTDDWEALSKGNVAAAANADWTSLYNQDILDQAAKRLEYAQQFADAEAEGYKESEPLTLQSAEDAWIQRTIQEIVLNTQEQEEDGNADQRSLTTTTTKTRTAVVSGKDNDMDEGLHMEYFLDEMGREIAMLVRCNESPTELLIASGRALPALSAEQLTDVRQLVVQRNDVHATWEATDFLRHAVHDIFQRHYQAAKKTEIHTPDGHVIPIWTADAVASWMTLCLQEEEKEENSQKQKLQPIGKHDRRVTATISKYSVYGTGYLTEPDLQNLYLSTIVGEAHQEDGYSAEHLQKYRAAEISRVWRDLRQHGILSPAEQERAQRLAEIGQPLVNKYDLNLMDECEIIDESYIPAARSSTTATKTQLPPQLQQQQEWKAKGKSSHELVELAYDQKTPLYLRDGEFVFIDEESCIGCMQCASAAPASFQMVEDGRFRTFAQRKSPEVATAVATCPVNCMHYVGFERLKELERARDSATGDGRTDHRHFGKASAERGGAWIPRTPLHVSRRQSDLNHKESWYHYLQNKCHKSSDCPQRGCFDCPRFQDNPQSNPSLQAKMKQDDHIRATHFMESGIADPYRKVAEL